MGLGSEARAMVRADLGARIDRIAHELPHMTPGRLAFAVDDIRRIARDYGLCPLAEIARNLESAIAASAGGAMVLPFLEAMSDAVECDSADPAVAQSYLASVSVRLHG